MSYRRHDPWSSTQTPTLPLDGARPVDLTRAAFDRG